MKLRNLQWYVLNPLGTTMREIIVVGPCATESEAAFSLGDPDVYHLALMDADRVGRALAEESRYEKALRPGYSHVSTAPRPERVSVSLDGSRTVSG